MTYENPKLVLTFLGDDLEEGHSTVQTIDDSWIVNRSIIPSLQHLNGLKSSSDQYSITLFRRCPSVEDIIATEGNIKAKLYVGETVKFTGFISTSYSWAVTDHGEQALVLTIESIGTRLFSQPFLETGYYFFDCPASAAVYNLINPLGLTIRQGDERKIVQPVRREAEAGKTVRDLIDSLFYECNAIYWFNADGELCIEKINADTTSALLVDSSHLFHLRGAAISLSKALRTYKGARVRYTDTGTADNYLVYRNTSGQDQRYPYCHLKLGAGEWYDGAEIYTDQEWTAATADQFREPTLISAVNAGSESSIVGSGNIIAISNAAQNVVCESGITVSIESVGGKWFKITAHNTTNADKYITRMDLYASIVYEKNHGVIRTQIDGPADGKSLLEEELSWIHDKDNAQKHANLLAQYHKSCGAVYTFYSDLSLTLGSVIELNDDVFSGLDVFVLVYAAKGLTDSELIEYKAVGVSTFNLDAPVWHGTTGSANPSGAQGPQGEPGASTQVEYAIGSSLINPPSEAMQWNGEDMLWDGEVMLWSSDLYSDEVPEMQRGKYIWMRTKVGDAPWQYTRLTGAVAWEAESLGVFTSACPTQSKQGLGLIPGDYFVAGAEFIDGGVTYKQGYAYVYTGSGWTVMDLEDPDNSSKALECLSALVTSGVNVSDSTASIWGWFENLVAQNAVVQNLKAQQALFDGIQVTGKSVFNGQVISDALTTYDASSGGTVSFVSETSGAHTINRSTVMAALGSYGTYKAIGGTITILEGWYGLPRTYSPSESNPLKIAFTSTGIEIRQTSDSSIVVTTEKEEAGVFNLRNGSRDFASISNCALVLANVPAGADVSVLTPANSGATLGTASKPFPAGYIGSFATTLPTGSYGQEHTYGHCTLPNGLELKWGYIATTDSGNDGHTSFYHSFTSDEGGPYETSTLFAIGYSRTCRIEIRPVSKSSLEVYKMPLGANSGYATGANIYWLSIGY